VTRTGSLDVPVASDSLAQVREDFPDDAACLRLIEVAGDDRGRRADMPHHGDAPIHGIHGSLDGGSGVDDAIVEDQQLIEVRRNQIVQHLAMHMVFLVAGTPSFNSRVSPPQNRLRSQRVSE
jgi:hypothetical protein